MRGGAAQYTCVCPSLPLHPSVVEDLISLFGPGDGADEQILLDELVKALEFRVADPAAFQADVRQILDVMAD